MVELTQGKFAVLVFFCAVVLSVSAIYFLTPEAPFPIRLGERQVYGVYSQGEKIGTLTLQVENIAFVENVECFVATYSLYLSRLDKARSGMLKFDADGNLRRAVTAEAEENAFKWSTEVGYSFAEKLMRVIVKDNRDPRNYTENDETVPLTGEVMVGEYVWYLLRTEPIQPGYHREFYLNLMPYATDNVHAAVRVVGEETVETPVDNFNCWVFEGENTRLVPWPIDRIWVDKVSGFVVKGIENQDGEEIVYMLEEKS